MRKNLLLSFAAFMSMAVLATSCSSDKDDTPESVPENEQVKILVINEGSSTPYSSGISGIMVDNSVDRNVYKTINSRELGNFGQSMIGYGDYYYVCVSGSKKIEVLSPDDFKIVKTITYNDPDFYPYKICVYKEGKIDPGDNSEQSQKLALVTNNNNNKMWVLNLEDDTIVSSADAMIPTQDAIVAGEYVFAIGAYYNPVTFDGTHQLRAIERTNIGSSTPVADVEPIDRSSIVMDKNDKLWVTTEEGLKRIDIDTKEVDREIALEFTPTPEELEAGKKPYRYSIDYTGRIAINSGLNYIYFNATDELEGAGKKYVYSITYGDTDLQNIQKICEYTSSVSSFYNMVISPGNTLLIADAGNFSSNGKVLEYNLNGDLKNTFNVGVSPYFFYFIDRD